MSPILWHLSLDRGAGLVAFALAFLSAIFLLRRRGQKDWGATLGSALIGMLSLGNKTPWKGSEEDAPDLLFPSMAFYFGLFLLISGKSFTLPVFSYGFTLMLGFTVGIGLGYARAPARGVESVHLLDAGMIVVISGIIGARTFYFIQFYDEHFASQPWWKFFAIWEGGIVYYGGLFLSAAAGSLYCWYRNYRILTACDIIAPQLALGLSFGRVGCFLNGCCWGRVCDPEMPFAVQFPQLSNAWWRHVEPYIGPDVMEAFRQSRGQDVDRLLSSVPASLQGWSDFVHPTQLYSWAAAVALGIFILIYERKWQRKDGQAFLLFFVLYAIQRFILETFRGDHSVIWSLHPLTMTPSQRVGVYVLPIAVAAFVWVSIKGRDVTWKTLPGAAPTEPESAAPGSSEGATRASS